MSTSPTENTVPGVVTFTTRGNAVLEQLADAFVAGCDGSPRSIATVLEQVLEADIEDLADAFAQDAPPARSASLHIDWLRPPGESTDAARRRLSTHSPGADGNSGVPDLGVTP